MSVTIRDVAQEAGVSASTVSKVLNNWSTISPQTVSRVHAAIQKLHYTPNARAVSFARGAASNIIFLSSLKKGEAYSNPHTFDILCGVRNELVKQNYTLMIADVPDGAEPSCYLSELISSKIADGILIHGSVDIPGMAKILQETHFPHIYIGYPGPDSLLSWIDTNNGLAGQFAARHILTCHYEKVAFIAESSENYISMRRLNGFLGGMNDYGYRLPEAYIRHTDSTREDACLQTMQVLSLPEPPRAIVCENSLLALGAVKAIQESGLKIPEEIALLTFDSYPYAALIEPAPTIIDIDVYDLGTQAAMMLIRKLQNPSLLVQSYTTLPVLKQGKTTRILAHQ